MLVQSPEGKMKVIDFRETAPRNSTKDMFLNASSQMVNILFFFQCPTIIIKYM